MINLSGQKGMTGKNSRNLPCQNYHITDKDSNLSDLNDNRAVVIFTTFAASFSLQWSGIRMLDKIVLAVNH
jgi:hypothetical protein